MPPLDPSAEAIYSSNACNKGNSYWCMLFGDTTTTGEAKASTISSQHQETAKRAANILPTAVGFPWKKRTLILLLLAVCAMTLLYLMSRTPEAQRVYQFWIAVTPWIVEYKCIQWKGRYIQKLPEEVLEQQLELFHKRTAPKTVALVQQLGGIYVKIGQLLSTVAVGILHDDYIRAMRPLQDGIPPRTLKEMAAIFEMSTGRKLEDVFEWVDEKPIGAASIGQAHRAILKKQHANDPDDLVVVKLQYPEVSKLFNADLNNLELVCRLISPGSREMVLGMRSRHSKELDFRDEAQHLRECANNMAKHGFEPSHVRIPRVRNETGVCTRHVLVMEYLQGTTLHAAIEQEQDRMARALGRKSGKALRDSLMDQIGEQLEQKNGAGGPDINRFQRFAMAPMGAAMFRAYVSVRNGLSNVQHRLLDLVQSREKRQERRRERQRIGQPIHMGRVLKTLVHVHGLQLLRDGVYNADPHPGNVLILPDGRLGLLDYGMVGRVTREHRRYMAKTILALHRQDKQGVQDIYRESGYRATWKEGDIVEDINIIHRFATFHFDKFDWSPVNVLTRGSTSQNDNQQGQRRQSIKLMDILPTTVEWSIPDWMEQGSRVTGLLYGVALQAGRPLSMAKEWHSIAEEAIEELGDEEQ